VAAIGRKAQYEIDFTLIAVPAQHLELIVHVVAEIRVFRHIKPPILVVIIELSHRESSSYD